MESPESWQHLYWITCNPHDDVRSLVRPLFSLFWYSYNFSWLCARDYLSNITVVVWATYIFMDTLMHICFICNPTEPVIQSETAVGTAHGHKYLTHLEDEYEHVKWKRTSTLVYSSSDKYILLSDLANYRCCDMWMLQLSDGQKNDGDAKAHVNCKQMRIFHS